MAESLGLGAALWSPLGTLIPIIGPRSLAQLDSYLGAPAGGRVRGSFLWGLYGGSASASAARTAESASAMIAQAGMRVSSARRKTVSSCAWRARRAPPVRHGAVHGRAGW